MIELNITLFIQVANFIIALIVLNILIIRPIRNIMKQRREIVSGFITEAGRMNHEAESRLQNYEAALDAARVDAAVQKEQVRQQGLSAEQEIMFNAQTEAQAFLQKSRQETEQEVRSAMDALRAQVNDFAGKAAARIME